MRAQDETDTEVAAVSALGDIEPADLEGPAELETIEGDERDENGDPIQPRDIQLPDIQLANQFIERIANATIANDPVPDSMRNRLLNPPRESPRKQIDDDPLLKLALKLFLSTPTNSRTTYTEACDGVEECFPGAEMPSYDKLKSRIADITGVSSVAADMCINSCLAFTGPLEDVPTCPECLEPRYDPKILAASRGKQKTPRQSAHTIPLGPQLQAMYSTPEGSAAMKYRSEQTATLLEELRVKQTMDSYGDFICGSDYLNSLSKDQFADTAGTKLISNHDICLMLSLDGAQLYQNKASDCWIFIWVIYELAPDKRYKKRYVLPGGFIPGPNKPKNLDSFLFLSLHHLSALMRDGLRIWDALTDLVFKSHPFLVVGTADGPGLAFLNGLNGHMGAYGCRLFCKTKGRLKPSGSHYYPALLKPHNYSTPGSDHGDVSVNTVANHVPSAEEYQRYLAVLESSQTMRQYIQNRRATGISKPSILSGLPRTLQLPKLFGVDLMHLISLNLTDLLLSLWRGTMDCSESDSKDLWDWMVLIGDTWKIHGAEVAAARAFLPGSLDRPPRNPALKISSGYKAQEFLTYIYGLGPGLFYRILPRKYVVLFDLESHIYTSFCTYRYWRHFCKLVYSIRLLHQHSISTADLRTTNTYLKSYVAEYEQLYYQRRADRLHFVRQSVHSLIHLPNEIPRMAMPCYYTQWTMERVIGDLGGEIKQPSQPYANLSQRGVARCQTNALLSIAPDLKKGPKPIPRGAEALGDEYVLLRAKDTTRRRVSEHAEHAITAYLSNRTQHDFSHAEKLRIVRWARLRLPCGQVARSSWKEGLRTPLRMSRNVKV